MNASTKQREKVFFDVGRVSQNDYCKTSTLSARQAEDMEEIKKLRIRKSNEEKF